MKKFILLFFLTVFAGNLAFSALPPFYQSSKELKALLNDERLHEKLGSGQFICDISRVEDSWLVTTSKYVLQVDVIYFKSEENINKVGPAEFKFYFNEPQDINNS